MKQSHLPDEIMFMELGFNGTFTFKQEDFPQHVNYVRIEGNDSNKYLFQKEHLWNIAAKRAKNEKLMFVDSDIAPLEDVDWFKQTYDALDKCLFTQGFRSITYLDQNDVPGGRVRSSYTAQIVENGKLSYAVPGGVYCIAKTTLQIMGYFNYLPVGGGDNVFWSELAGLLNHYPWFTLCRRENVPICMETLKKLTGKSLLDEVFVDVYHFYHGESKGRSYRQRHYMMMTQFPWMDSLIMEDEQGLLAWVDTSHYFYEVMSQLPKVNNDPFIANRLFGDNFRYLEFSQELERLIKQKFEKYKKKYQQRSIIAKIMRDLVMKYSARGNRND